MYISEDWYEAVRKCKRQNPFKVIVLDQNDIFSVKQLQNQIVKKNILDNKEKLKFSKICCFKFTSENPNILYVKHVLNEEYKTVNIGKKGIRKSIQLSRDLRNKYNNPVPINQKKIQNLARLIQYIPPIYHEYYVNIGVPVNQIEQTAIVEDIVEVENLDEFSEIESSSDEES